MARSKKKEEGNELALLSPQEAVMLERQVVFWDMYKQGRSIREIARLNKLSPATVGKDIKSFIGTLREAGLRHVEEHRFVQLERIQSAIQAIWPRVEEGRTDAIGSLVRLMEREARLLGLDAPTKVDITAKIKAMAFTENVSEEEAIDIAEGVYREISA